MTKRAMMLALAVLAAPVATYAEPVTYTPSDVGLISGMYPDAAVGGDSNSVEAVLAQLKAVCHSSNSYDKDRCARAWKLINAAKARLDAQNAARR